MAGSPSLRTLCQGLSGPFLCSADLPSVYFCQHKLSQAARNDGRNDGSSQAAWTRESEGGSAEAAHRSRAGTRCSGAHPSAWPETVLLPWARCNNSLSCGSSRMSLAEWDQASGSIVVNTSKGKLLRHMGACAPGGCRTLRPEEAAYVQHHSVAVDACCHLYLKSCCHLCLDSCCYVYLLSCCWRLSVHGLASLPVTKSVWSRRYLMDRGELQVSWQGLPLSCQEMFEIMLP